MEAAVAYSRPVGRKCWCGKSRSHDGPHTAGIGNWFRGIGVYFYWRRDRQTGDAYGEPRRVVVLGYEPMNGRGDRVVFREEGSQLLKVICTRTGHTVSTFEIVERGPSA